MEFRNLQRMGTSFYNGTRGDTDGQFENLVGVAVDSSDDEYIIDYTGRIQKFISDGTFIASEDPREMVMDNFPNQKGPTVAPNK